MVRYLRNPGTAARRALVLLAWTAMALQAAVPTGLMLDLDQSTGDLVYLLCPSQGAAPGSPAHADRDARNYGIDHSLSGAAHPSYEMPSAVCDFAVTSVPPPTATPVVIGLQLVEAPEPFIEYRQVVPAGIIRTAVSSRGPPRDS